MPAFMKTLVCLIGVLLATAVPSRAQAPPERDPEIYYDIYVQDSSLTVWIDYSPFLGSRSLERLRDGVDLALECRAELTSPRWLWTDRLIAERTRTIRLSFRNITNDYLVDLGRTDSDKPRTFVTEEELVDYLSDSIEIQIDQITQIDPDKRYCVALRITAISLTDLNLVNGVAAGTESGSPVKFLFRQFLEMTDYGRRQASTKSRPFLISDLPVSK